MYETLSSNRVAELIEKKLKDTYGQDPREATKSRCIRLPVA